MIIIDFSQVLISNVAMQVAKDKNKTINIDLLRHMVLNSIRGYISKNRSIYGSEIVIAIDDRNSWRKSVFPLYKKKRRLDKEESDIDWKDIYVNLDIIKNELKEFSPYKIIEVEGCEADDIIAVLTKLYAPHQKILIVSGDSDFHQLHKLDNVWQYSPAQKTTVKLTENESKLSLKSKIICGDKGDGVPNFLSSDNSIVDGIRQKSITKKNLDIWLNTESTIFCVTGEMQRNWARNKMLIDFDEIPNTIKECIINTYTNTQPNTKKSLVKYFMNNQLVNLLDCMNDF